jgi:hypothetical protein
MVSILIWTIQRTAALASVPSCRVGQRVVLSIAAKNWLVHSSFVIPRAGVLAARPAAGRGACTLDSTVHRVGAEKEKREK